MRYLVALWALPLVLFWGWYFLSINDMNFGYVFLTRDVNHIIFKLYGDILGIDPATIPMMVAKACVFDGFLIGCIFAFRSRKAIIAWVRRKWSGHAEEPSASSTASLSSTPCNMNEAAAESMRVSRLRRDTSISISARSAATVDSLSSQNANGSSDMRAMLLTKARDA